MTGQLHIRLILVIGAILLIIICSERGWMKLWVVGGLSSVLVISYFGVTWRIRIRISSGGGLTKGIRGPWLRSITTNWHLYGIALVHYLSLLITTHRRRRSTRDKDANRAMTAQGGRRRRQIENIMSNHGLTQNCRADRAGQGVDSANEGRWCGVGVIRGDCQTLSGHIRRRAERWTEFGVGGNRIGPYFKHRPKVTMTWRNMQWRQGGWMVDRKEFAYRERCRWGNSW